MKLIKKKIDNLRMKLNHHEYLYHTLNSPMISDFEYDRMLKKLVDLENKYKFLISNQSPTRKLGSSILSSQLKSFAHLTPMLSLKNIFKIKALYVFFNKVRNILFQEKKNIKFCVELKFDGLALNLLYKKGRLFKAVTRGDGEKGEDVTKNAQMISSIPLFIKGKDIPDLLEIRGEVLINKIDFLKLNHDSALHGKKIFSNPRNAAAGTLRQGNSKIVFKRNLSFFCYGIGFFIGKKNFSSHFKSLHKLEKLGFLVHKYRKICVSEKEVLSFYNKVQRKRSFFGFDIDGIVVKVDRINFQNKIGNSHKFPNWAIAFKFPSLEKTTTILKVDFQVGRTGIITPVAVLKPINISGVMVSKASLYNKKELKRLDLHYGDTISVCRAGDVIPKIKNVILFKRILNAKKIRFPKICPICGSVIANMYGFESFYCTGRLFCLAQKKKMMYHFFSKKGINVKYLGKKIISRLIQKRYVNLPVDFFYLSVENLSQLRGINLKLSTKIVTSLQKARRVKLHNFIYSLGIPLVGEYASRKLSFYFKHIDSIFNASLDEIRRVKGIGRKTAENLFFFLKERNNKEVICNLLNVLQIDLKSKSCEKLFLKFKEKNFFFKKRILFTGKLHSFKRVFIEEKMILLGAKINRKIGNSTNLIIAGENPGKNFFIAKLRKIKIINEKEMLFLLKNYMGRAGFEPATN